MKKNKPGSEPLFRVTYLLTAYDPAREDLSEREITEILNAPTACHAIAKIRENLEIIAQRAEQDFGSAIYQFTAFSAVSLCPHCRGTGLA